MAITGAAAQQSVPWGELPQDIGARQDTGMWKLALLTSLLVACGKPGLNEECSTSNSTDECDDGLVCTKEANATVCLKSCTNGEACPTGTTCSGVSGGSEKSCQPKP
jgi:hypothetical protein